MKLLARLLGLLAPRHDREMLLGDLLEERALLAFSLSAREVSRWYRGQMIRSLAPLVWANIRRGGWLKTLGAALVGYVAVVVMVELTSDIAMSKLLGLSMGTYSLISLVAGLASMMVGGLIAASMRPRGSAALAAFSALMGVVSLVITGDRAPLWYQFALILLCPVGALTGGRILRRRRQRS